MEDKGRGKYGVGGGDGAEEKERGEYCTRAVFLSEVECGVRGECGLLRHWGWMGIEGGEGVKGKVENERTDEKVKGKVE